MHYCAIFASHALSAIMFKTLLALFSQVMNGIVVLLVALAGYDSCPRRALVLGFAYPSKCLFCYNDVDGLRYELSTLSTILLTTYQ